MLQKMPLTLEVRAQPPQHLHALDQQHIVYEGHHAGALGHGQVGAGEDQIVGLGPDAGERLVIAGAPLREHHGRLQIKVDAPFLDRVRNNLQHFVVADTRMGSACGALLLERDDILLQLGKLDDLPLVLNLENRQSLGWGSGQEFLLRFGLGDRG